MVMTSSTIGAQLAEGGDHYAVLGLSPTASREEIQRAYHALALTVHPDKQSGALSARQSSTLTFAELHDVYHTLIDEQKRARYDERRRAQALSAISAQQSTIWLDISWKEMEYEEEDEEEGGEDARDYAGDADSSDSDDGLDEGGSYTHTCKCGHVHRVSAADIRHSPASPCPSPSISLLCPSCSLGVRIHT